MWIFTDKGFISAVEDRKDSKFVYIRSRVKEDLQTLFPAHKLILTPSADYPFRVRALKDDFAQKLAGLALDLDYHNFKGQVRQSQGADRAATYHEVWHVLREDLDPREPPMYQKPKLVSD